MKQLPALLSCLLALTILPWAIPSHAERVRRRDSVGTKHHLPKGTVLARYNSDSRIILRTDENRANDNDHINLRSPFSRWRTQ